MNKNVPLFNLKEQHDSLKNEINQAALDALNSMKWLLGPKTQEFEQNFAKALNAKYCITCSSGASAIQIALMAAGIGKGDEVITTPFTFVATTTSISLTGADFVFADIDHYSAPCTAVKLSKNNTADFCHLIKFFCLIKSVLTCGCIKHKKDFLLRIRKFPFDYAVYLSKFVHQILFIMKSSCCIADADICTPALCR